MSQAILECGRFIVPGIARSVESDWRPGRALALVAVTAPLAVVAALALLFWGRGAGVIEVCLLAVTYALTAVGLEVGYHRLFAHHSFQTTWPIRALLAILGAMAGKGPVAAWVAIHRRGHQLGDRPASESDLSHWTSDLQRDRAILWVDRHYRVWIALGLIVPAFAGGLCSGTWGGVLCGFLWGGLLRLLLAHHATWSVNSFGHLWGTRRFRSRDESRNNLPLAILSLGGGWRNNHSAFPTSAAHGLEWWQMDVSFWVIRGLEVVRLAWDVKRPVH